MNFNISQMDWANTPDPVKDYINELHRTIKNLQTELNKYIASNRNDVAETLCFNGLSEFLVTQNHVELGSDDGFSFESRFYVNGNRSGEFKIMHVHGENLVGRTNWLKYGKGIDLSWLSWQYSGVWWGIYGSSGIAKVIHSGHARQGDVNPPMWYMEGKDDLVVNQWYHVCGTWDGEELKLYIDGELVNSAPFTEEVKLATQAYIGASYGGHSQFFPGMLDNVRIWKKSLTVQEVKLHSNGCMIDDEENLVINYCAKKAPVLMLQSIGEQFEKVEDLENQIGDTFDDLPSAQKSLIEDLKNHLRALNKKRSGI
jgi:hypothetical protein